MQVALSLYLPLASASSAVLYAHCINAVFGSYADIAYSTLPSLRLLVGTQPQGLCYTYRNELLHASRSQIPIHCDFQYTAVTVYLGFWFPVVDIGALV